MTFTVMNIMALDKGISAWFTKEAILGRVIGIFGFAVLDLCFCARNAAAVILKVKI